MFTKYKPKNHAGFTLVEVMLSVAILGAGLVGVAQFQGNIQKYSTITKQRIEALNIAEETMEEIRHFATVGEYEANVTNKITGATTSSATSHSTTTSYSVDSTVTATNNGLGADILVKVSWPDINANGAVTDNSTIYLSTKVSNSVPLNFAIATAGVPRDTTEEPDLPVLTFPGDPNDNTQNCSCSTFTASLSPEFDSGYRKVGMGGGMHGGGGSTTPPSSSSPECTECCTIAYAMYDEGDIRYVNLDQYDEPDSIEEDYSGSMEDRVIGNETFDWRYLIKGYEQKTQQQRNLEDRILKTMGGMGGGSTTYIRKAACTFETITTVTTVRRMHMTYNIPQ